MHTYEFEGLSKTWSVIPIFRMDQGRLELTTPEVKAGTEASSQISVVSFLEMTRFLPPSRSTPYGLARLEITVKTIPTDGVTTPCIPNNTCSYL